MSDAVLRGKTAKIPPGSAFHVLQRAGSVHRVFLLLQLCNPANPGSPEVSLCNPVADLTQHKHSSIARRMHELL